MDIFHEFYDFCNAFVYISVGDIDVYAVSEYSENFSEKNAEYAVFPFQFCQIAFYVWC